RVVQVGPPRELYEQPNSRFVADFLGESNFIAGTIAVGDGGKVVVHTPVGEIEAPPAAGGSATRPRWSPGTPVTCSIRPEGIRLEPATENGTNTLRGRCREAIYLGDTAQVLIELADGTAIKVQQPSPH